VKPKWAIAAVIFVVLMGPVLYVFARAQALQAAFERVSVGDTQLAVRKAMGPPVLEERVHPALHAEVEYRYSVWPLPTTWAVGFTDGKVIDKSELRR
jgi:hypothetical protein